MGVQSRKKIAVIIGTRPEAIKLAPVITELEKNERLDPVVVSSGQHREMLNELIKTFSIRLDADLDVMRPNHSLAALSGRLLKGLDSWLNQSKPDMVLVHGDTTTMFNATLVSFYRQIPLGYVEAGLRTGNLRYPFPEEANRKLATPLMSLHFAPTEGARQNLLAEGIADKIITVTGNTVIDALHMEIQRQKSAEVQRKISKDLAALLGSDWQDHPYILVTGHRRENFGDGLKQICQGLVTLAHKFKEMRFIYPVHINPNVQKPVRELMGNVSNIFLIPPQGYPQFVTLMSHCRLVLTDSGGIQEEAPALGKPVLVMRNTTERPEGVISGTVKLVGANAELIVKEVSTLLTNPLACEKMRIATNPYGDGHAAPKIISRILEFFNPSLK